MKKPPKTKINYIKSLPMFIVACFVFLAVCGVALAVISSSTVLAEDAQMATVEFRGEYKTEGREWVEITPGEHISPTRGDVTLRGNFVFISPDGDVLTDNPAGAQLNMYLNHISMTVRCGGEELTFDVEHPELGAALCGAMWVTYEFPSSADGVVELVISNPHPYGNELAIDQLLTEIVVESPAVFVQMITEDNDVFRYVGYVFFVIACIVLGVALVASILKISGVSVLWIIGCWTFFTGALYLLDTADVCLWNANAAFNTAALALARMLSSFFLGLFATSCLSGKRKKTATYAHVGIAALISVLAVLSAFGVGRIYDTMLYWQIAQLAVVAVLLTCGVMELPRMRGSVRLMFACCGASLLLTVIDLFGISLAWWDVLYLSKINLSLVFVAAICYGIYTVITNYKMSVRAQEIQTELENKSVAVMISQIQPHFLYNSLNSIAELCVVDPRRAEKATIDFARYLRGNMGALNDQKTIEFDDELNHLNHYIALEKLRYGDDLQFEFDIKTKAFALPALTVQPLVENAVNHGIRYHKMKGSVKISSREDAESFYVVIEDDGVGFDPDVLPDDGRKHVGISNVKYRLEVMCGGSVDIKSQKGVGTTVTIIIPKERQK